MTPFDALAAALARSGVPFRRDVPLAPLTWMGVGGPAAVLAEPRRVDDLAALERACVRLGVRLERLGAGANLLVDDAPLPMAVVRLCSPGFRAVELRGDRVRAGAGAPFEPLIWRTLDAGLSGLEGLVGIPATLGGALAMNAGSRHGEVSDRVVSVTASGPRGIEVLSRGECGFGYRTSALRGRTVLEAEFELGEGDPEALRAAAREVREAKRRTQPLAEASAGCMFRNPPGDSAGRLIDAAGLKGLSVGAARVSRVHANFLVNPGGAKADDIRRLIDRVRDGVRRAHGVVLELEVVAWP